MKFPKMKNDYAFNERGDETVKTARGTASRILIMLAVLLLAAGCGNNAATGGNSSSSGDGTSEQPKTENVTITIEAGQAMVNNNPYVFSQANFDEFERQTGIKVELIIDPDNQVKNVLQTKLATGEHRI